MDRSMRWSPCNWVPPELRLDSAFGSDSRADSAQFCSTWNALNNPSMRNTMTTASGRPMMIVAFCSVAMPPIMSIAKVNSPVAPAQKIRTQAGPSDSLSVIRELKCDITSAPESALVT